MGDGVYFKSNGGSEATEAISFRLLRPFGARNDGFSAI